MTRFILLFSAIFIFNTSYASESASDTDPTHVTFKQVFIALKRWNSVPKEFRDSFVATFPSQYPLLDALEQFDGQTRTDTPLPRKDLTEKVAKSMASRIDSHFDIPDFCFPMIRRIKKEDLVDFVWSAVEKTPFGEAVKTSNKKSAFKDSILFSSLFSVSHETNYNKNPSINGFTIIKTFFLPPASGSTAFVLRPDILDQAIEKSSFVQSMLSRPSSRASSYTNFSNGDGGSVGESDSIRDRRASTFSSRSHLGAHEGTRDRSHSQREEELLPSPPPLLAQDSQTTPAFAGASKTEDNDLRRPLLGNNTPTSPKQRKEPKSPKKTGCC